jgi:hypothetical protein
MAPASATRLACSVIVQGPCLTRASFPFKSVLIVSDAQTERVSGSLPPNTTWPSSIS